MGQLVFHLLQEWIGINRLNPSFIVWKKSHLNRLFQAFERMHCSALNNLINMKTQIWKFENNFGLVTFMAIYSKHVLRLVPGFVGLDHICLHGCPIVARQAHKVQPYKNFLLYPAVQILDWTFTKSKSLTFVALWFHLELITYSCNIFHLFNIIHFLNEQYWQLRTGNKKGGSQKPACTIMWNQNTSSQKKILEIWHTQ